MKTSKSFIRVADLGGLDPEPPVNCTRSRSRRVNCTLHGRGKVGDDLVAKEKVDPLSYEEGQCPGWLGNIVHIHKGVKDPSAGEDSKDESGGGQLGVREQVEQAQAEEWQDIL